MLTTFNGHFESPLLRPSSACSVLMQPCSLQPASDERPQIQFEGGFAALIDELKAILGPNKGLSSEDVDIERVKAAMERYTLNEAEWGRFALHDATRNYSRNGIVDINGNANLLILVWLPGKSSAIHDHANAHCCMKILKGQLTESLYAVPAEGEAAHQLVPRQQTVLQREVVGYISDKIGLHKISNSASDVLVSLHLYTPPYAAMYGCSMYDAATGQRHHVDMSKYYSWQGQLVSKDGGSTC